MHESLHPLLAGKDLAFLAVFGGAATLAAVKPQVGLAVGGVFLTAFGTWLSIQLGPTSPQLTTAAVYIVGGLACAGLGGVTGATEGMDRASFEEPPPPIKALGSDPEGEEDLHDFPADPRRAPERDLIPAPVDPSKRGLPVPCNRDGR